MSAAETVAEYLADLEPDRRATIDAVRDVILASLPAGYEENLGWGMLAYEVPLRRYPDTYNGKPLMYAALAAQKNHNSLYLMGLYSGAAITEADLRARWQGGRRPDLGKSCLRFRAPADLDLALVSEVVSSCSLERFVELASGAHAKPRAAGG